MSQTEQGATLQHPSMRAGLFVWSFGAVFYLLGFFHRVAPAVITGELMRDFQIGAAALGNLSAFYFYSYVAMQVPTGILADRLGPRRLLTYGALCAAGGAVLFGIAPDLATASAGRLLIGGSVAVAFVCLLKIAACWFSPNRFALVSGLALFAGVVGAVCAGVPLRLLTDWFGWRMVFVMTAGVALLVAAGTWFYVRDYPTEKGYRNFLDGQRPAPGGNGSGAIQGIGEILRYRNTWLLFFIPGGMVGAVLTFAGLWGVPYLVTVHGYSKATAATLASVLMVSWAVGGPLFGWLSDRIGRRKPLYLAGCFVALAGWAVILLSEKLSFSWLVILLLLTGFATGVIIISFAFAKESVPLRLAGTISGLVNMGVMSGPMVLQPAVGLVLDRLWQGETVAGGVRVYDAFAYRAGFSLLLFWLLVSLILLVFTQETWCRQQAEEVDSTSADAL